MAHVISTVEATDVRAAVLSLRSRVRLMAEPRLYFTALSLALLKRQRLVSQWSSWDAPPPLKGQSLNRATFANAMWSLFGTTRIGMLREESAAWAACESDQVMLDPFYDTQKPNQLTLVTKSAFSGHSPANSLKLDISDPGWRWHASGTGTTEFRRVEYNASNTLNQQNGISCAMSPAEAAASAAGAPTTYQVDRSNCIHHAVTAKGPTCSLNGKTCGSLGDGVARDRTKPRLYASTGEGSAERVLLPDAFDRLLDAATASGRFALPRAEDMALLTSWCHNSGAGKVDSMRFLSLLGPEGIERFTDTK